MAVTGGMVRRQRQLLLLLTGGVLLLLGLLLVYSSYTVRRRPVPISEPVCRPQINIAFLKTHKCASTTVQNILFRFGLRHNLTFVLPRQGNYLGRREPFRAELVRHLPWHPLGYNILAVHNRWDHGQVASVMPANTTFVTALRDPEAVFRSMYAYVEHDRFMPLDEFLEQEPIPEERFFHVLGRNQMLWDLGLPEERLTDPEAIGRLVADTERRFHLVMLAERMDESLVLLKHLLCWRTEDVVGLRLNALRPEARDHLSQRGRLRLRRWLAGDYQLYNHFRRVFERRVAEFGEERMRREVAELRAANERAFQECGMVSSQGTSLSPDFAMFSQRVTGFQPRNRTRDCEELARPELSFVELLRERQLQMARDVMGVTPHPSRTAAGEMTRRV
ncbi:Galactosylceramide sulfotransferase [Amphibalanus amphitrite]|uniref:Galactosylceramide sulfotransferase n=1 Tax=Amphibalanus amphitrite TaxID=1232801 RepID=A0A6A4W3F3_AMPAM|nr:Galactosylceramide sulfotransferase [Amphibalanus amphitrite]